MELLYCYEAHGTIMAMEKKELTAREMARLRWEKMSDKERAANIRVATDAAREKRMKLSPAKRSSLARKAAAARWGKKGK